MKHCKPGLRYRRESRQERGITLTAELESPTEKLKPRMDRKYVHAVQLFTRFGSRDIVLLPCDIPESRPMRFSARKAQRMARRAT
jgi:hypothetical protein